MRQFKRVLSMFLAILMVTSLLPMAVIAENVQKTKTTSAYQPSEQAIQILAEAENTVTVNAKDDSTDDSDINGILDMQAGSYDIERDYEQACMITVTNTSDKTVEFYLEADNPYADLSLEIIKSGSDESPVVILAGETLEVELTVFAQNAENEKYSIPITAYVKDEDIYTSDASATAVLNCKLPYLDLSWTLLSEDKSTLRQKYRLTNNGDTLTDLVLSASGNAAEYVSFDPILSNYELAKGASVEFTAQPDLAKMKANGVSKVEGYLVAASAGKTSQVACTFDTNGEEITVTTMGELARQQDGNPFTKFEVIEDSIELEYFDGEKYVSAESTELDDYLDENQQFDIKFSTDVDLGVEAPLEFEANMSSEQITDPNFKAENTPEVLIDENGSVSLNFSFLLSNDEYQALLEKVEQAVADGIIDEDILRVFSVRLFSVSDNEAAEQTDFLINIGLKINSFCQSIDEDLLYDEALGKLGDILDIWGSVKDIGGALINPNMSNDDKIVFCILEISQFIFNKCLDVVGKTSPLLWILCELTKWVFELLVDMVQDSLDDDAFAEIRNQVDGYQCTNRGKLTADFYVPNYSTGNNSDVKIHASSRMYLDGYSDQADTNYDITLNGESAGKTQNTGVTEMAMAEIPTDALKLGEVNRLEFDYDTFPGHYFVNTETTITLLYPNDTEIGYIGTPDELQDVRSLPNAAVYPENIYVEDDLFVGEESLVKFNVYNIGSRGGWFDIVVNDGTEDVYTKKNFYLNAFSSNPFAFYWTPDAETTTLTVSLVHTSVNLEERDSTNNTAAKALTVREREVPVIENVYADDTVYAESSYTVSADVSSYADVLSVKFSVDGTELTGDVNSAIVDNTKRYWLTSAAGLALGEHEVSVVVTYTTGYSTETVSEDFTVTAEKRPVQIPVISVYSASTLMYGDDFIFGVYDIDDLLRTELAVDSGTASEITAAYTYDNQLEYVVSAEDWTAGEHTVTIDSYYQGENGEQAVTETYTITVVSEEDSYYSFSLDDTIISPSYSLYKTDYQYCWVESTENGYRFKKTVDMYENPEEYTLVVKHDSGILVQSLDEEKPTLSTEECSTLTITSEHDFTISYVAIEQIDSLDIQNIYLNKTDSMMFTPAVYSLYLYVNVDGYSFSIYPAVDLTEGNAVIDLDSYILRYTFKIENADNNWYNARLYYRYSGSKYWSSYYLNTSYDSSENILECFTSASYLLSNVENAEEVRIVVYSEDEVYITQVKAPVSTYSLHRSAAADEIYTLNREDLHEVKLVCEEDGLTVESVEVSIDNIYVTLNSDTIYVPAGDIELAVSLDIGTQTLSNEVSITVEEDCEVTVDEGLSENLADVTISWDKQFDENAYVSCSTNSGNWAYANNFKTGNKLKVETGFRWIDVSLKQGKNSFDFSSYLNDLTNEGDQIHISSELTANIYENFGTREGGDTISMYIDDIYDAAGNEMTWWNIHYDQPLYVNVIYTDIDDSERVFVDTFTTTSRWIYSEVPNAGGTFHIEVEIYSAVLVSDGPHTHVYQYSNNGDGTHTVSCRGCDYEITEDHIFDDTDICSRCSADKSEQVHSNTDGVYETDADQHWKVCDDCDTPYAYEQHTESDWIVDETAHKEGSRHKECTVCGYIIETETVRIGENKMLFPKLFNVQITVGAGGKTNVSDTFLIAYGANRNIKITPDEGYEIADVIINGVSVGAVEEYSIRGASHDYSIEIIFNEMD